MQIFQIFFFSDVMWDKNIQKIMSQINVQEKERKNKTKRRGNLALRNREDQRVQKFNTYIKSNSEKVYINL